MQYALDARACLCHFMTTGWRGFVTTQQLRFRSRKSVGECPNEETAPTPPSPVTGIGGKHSNGRIPRPTRSFYVSEGMVKTRGEPVPPPAHAKSSVRRAGRA
jgi:hypothetical protein